MKKLLRLGVAFAVLAAGPALAADLGRRPAYKAPQAPPPPAPVYSWTGFYIGLNAGYHWGRNCVDTVTTNVSSISGLNGDIGAAVASQGTGSACPNDNGFIGGGQIGYNWQLTNWVVGIETDIQGASNNSNQDSITNISTVPNALAPPPFNSSTGTITSSKDLKWLGTLRGRVGFLATPSFLVYGTGGLAYGKVDASTNITETLGFIDAPGPFGTSGSFSDTRTGWTVGGGVEWMFAPNWSVKAEYLYYDLGQVTWSLGNINQFGKQFGFFGPLLETVSASQSTSRFNGNIVRAGINWHF